MKTRHRKQRRSSDQYNIVKEERERQRERETETERERERERDATYLGV